MSAVAELRRITEIGVAVRDLERATALLVDLFGGQAGEVQRVDRYGMYFRMVRVGKVDFELMEPVGEAGVIADFLSARGEGLHHVAFAVADVDDAVRSLAGKGVQFVAERPEALALDVVDFAGRVFSEELRFAFSHPKSLFGVLFEFIEYPPDYATP